jgi:twitching motility protein PilI
MDDKPLPDSLPATHTPRQSLRDYQRELAERTTLAQASPASSSRQLGFSAAGRGWLIDLSDAAEIMPVPAVTPVPGTQAWFLGLINHRGKLTGVVDFEQFLGHDSASRRLSGRLIVLSDRFPVVCALRVAAVSGLVDPCRRADGEIPSYFDTATAEKPVWQGREERINDRQWHRLDVAKLMSDSRFADASL